MLSDKQIKTKYSNLLHDVATKEFYSKIDLTNRVNCYVCRECGHVTKTIDVDPGVTPFFHLCEKCGGLAKSTFYRDIVPDNQPTEEWYRPTLKQVLKLRNKPDLLEHILQGGLNYRKCTNQTTKSIRMKIYVASSWRNEFQQEVVKQLRELGHEVYDFKNPQGNGENSGFHWSEIDPHWQDWHPSEYVKNLKHPIAERGFKSDFDAMKWADCCIMVLPCGRSANTEAGWMKGAGKEVHVFMPIAQEPELMYKIYDSVLTEFDQLQTLGKQ